MGRAPTVLSFAAAFALPAPERALLAFVSIFLKKGAFFRISGSTMKRTWLPRRKQLRRVGGAGCGWGDNLTPACAAGSSGPCTSEQLLRMGFGCVPGAVACTTARGRACKGPTLPASGGSALGERRHSAVPAGLGAVAQVAVHVVLRLVELATVRLSVLELNGHRVPLSVMQHLDGDADVLAHAAGPRRPARRDRHRWLRRRTPTEG